MKEYAIGESKIDQGGGVEQKGEKKRKEKNTEGHKINGFRLSFEGGSARASGGVKFDTPQPGSPELPWKSLGFSPWRAWAGCGRPSFSASPGWFFCSQSILAFCRDDRSVTI